VNVSADSSSTALNTIISTRVRQSAVADNEAGTKNSNALSESELKQIQQLKARDQVVRAHEAAHIAAGHGLVSGGAQYSYQQGPDGIQYAVGGEVQIDVSEVASNPQATLEKAQQIQAAALAPSQPSAQDRNIAAQAAQMAIEARAEIQQLKNVDKENGHSTFSTPEEKNTHSLDLIA